MTTNMRSQSPQPEVLIAARRLSDTERFVLIDGERDGENGIVDMARELHIGTPAPELTAIEELSSSTSSKSESGSIDAESRGSGNDGPRHNHHHHHKNQHRHHPHQGPPPPTGGHGRFGHHSSHSPPDWAPFKDEMRGPRGHDDRGMPGRGGGMHGRGGPGHHHGPPPPHHGHRHRGPPPQEGMFPPPPPPPPPSGCHPHGMPHPGRDGEFPPPPRPHHPGSPHDDHSRQPFPPPGMDGRDFDRFRDAPTPQRFDAGSQPHEMRGPRTFGGPSSGMHCRGEHVRFEGHPHGPPPHFGGGVDRPPGRTEIHQDRGGRGHHHHHRSGPPRFANGQYNHEIPA